MSIIESIRIIGIILGLIIITYITHKLYDFIEKISKKDNSNKNRR
jgi:hypothetical protein